MRNETHLEFTDISGEVYRTYVFPSLEVTIHSPTHLNVSESGGHRILDSNGTSHYIPNGWVHLYWEVHDGFPNFVK